MNMALRTWNFAQESAVLKGVCYIQKHWIIYKAVFVRIYGTAWLAAFNTGHKPTAKYMMDGASD